ncbi:MAG: hypothetical protein IJT50_04000 [Lentisphaeria bacterium]|nr:hypothetical protein [Lentisphaeria bacterium]
MTSKKTKNVGAATSSVSEETKQTTKEETKSVASECVCQQENKPDKKFVIEGKAIDFETAKTILSDFVTKCASFPEDIADKMRETYTEWVATSDSLSHQEKMTQQEIIGDAEAIVKTMKKLFRDYSKEHDHANVVFDKILGRYVPGLQTALRKIAVEQSDYNPELEASKAIIFDFVKECSHFPESKASALVSLSNEYNCEIQYKEYENKMTPDEIIADANTIKKTMKELIANYSKEYEHANKVLDGILARYVPSLQKAFEERVNK